MVLPIFTISVASIIVTSSLMCLFMLSVNASTTSVEKFRKFTRQTDFNQTECPMGDEVFSKTAKRVTQCLIHCYNEKSCRTVLYDAPKCNGCTDTYMTWCGLHGAHVVSFETEEEHNAVKETAEYIDTGVMGFFIGFNDCETNSEWRDYTTGDAATFLDFHPPEPTNTDGECCVIMFMPWHFKWADFSCSGPYRTLCEKPAS